MADFNAEVPLDILQINHCIAQAVQRYPNVHPMMLKVVLGTEGGQVGTIRKNKDNSYDLGPAQINTIHLIDVFKEFGYTAKDLVYTPCKNIMISAWLLSKHMTDSGNNIWKSIGNYHSKSPGKRRSYLLKAAAAYERLVVGIKSGRESEAIGRTTNWGKSTRPLSSVPSLARLEAAIQDDSSLMAWKPHGSSKPRFKQESKIINIDTRQQKLRFID